MKHIYRHLQSYIFKGLLALIPIALAVFTVNILYVFIDKQIMELVDTYTGIHIPGLGLLIFIVLLYATGVIASNVAGRRLFSLLDAVTGRIPLINTVWQVGKQLAGTLSLPEKNIFKKPVLIEYFKPGTWVIGFVTGEILDSRTGKKLLKIFIPTVPNPTSGFLVIVGEELVQETSWSVEEAIKMVISLGIIGPESIKAPSA
ncbi:MAG: DUF502 domain-containing protein [Deltaproteobacteria bacterium]|nr:DUF502 domain-containing protein [Deltaproteobacteria bacterium]